MGRVLGVALGLGVAVGVGVVVGVPLGVGVGVGDGPPCGQYLPPVLVAVLLKICPPQMIISLVVHTAV